MNHLATYLGGLGVGGAIASLLVWVLNHPGAQMAQLIEINSELRRGINDIRAENEGLRVSLQRVENSLETCHAEHVALVGVLREHGLTLPPSPSKRHPRTKREEPVTE